MRTSTFNDRQSFGSQQGSEQRMIIDTGKEIINNNMENHNQVQESKMLRLV